MLTDWPVAITFCVSMVCGTILYMFRVIVQVVEKQHREEYLERNAAFLSREPPKPTSPKPLTDDINWDDWRDGLPAEKEPVEPGEGTYWIDGQECTVAEWALFLGREGFVGWERQADSLGNPGDWRMVGSTKAPEFDEYYIDEKPASLYVWLCFLKSDNCAGWFSGLGTTSTMEPLITRAMGYTKSYCELNPITMKTEEYQAVPEVSFRRHVANRVAMSDAW